MMYPPPSQAVARRPMPTWQYLGLSVLLVAGTFLISPLAALVALVALCVVGWVTPQTTTSRAVLTVAVAVMAVAVLVGAPAQTYGPRITHGTPYRMP